MNRGRKTLSYQFRFKTAFQNINTILQSYTGVIDKVDRLDPDPNQNLIQTYTVTKINHRARTRTNLGSGQTLIVPPNNQGLVTPFYNQNDDGEMPAKGGATTQACAASTGRTSKG